MNLGLGLSLSLNRGASFSPETLFASSETGAWYDVSDTSTLWQDTAGTTPVTTTGQSVARIDDKSGNANNATQATAGSMPTYQVDGNGNGYLLFDGTDDSLRSIFTIAQPIDRVSAIQQITWTAFDRIFDGGNNDAAQLYQRTGTPQVAIFSGSVFNTTASVVGSNMVVTERHNGASSRIAINGGAYTTGNAGTSVPAGVSIGNHRASSNAGNIRLYGTCMIGRELTDSETTSLREYMAGISGVSL